MLRDKIIKAWKDPEYRMSLSEEDRAELPENPAGAIELTDEELDLATGGHNPSWYRPSQSQSASASVRPTSYSARPSNYSARPSSFSTRPLQPYSSNASQSYSQRPSGSWRPSGSYSYYRR
jgi:mersacidin/lichenicidin family type 2 lantibiotic